MEASASALPSLTSTPAPKLRNTRWASTNVASALAMVLEEPFASSGLTTLTRNSPLNRFRINQKSVSHSAKFAIFNQIVEQNCDWLDCGRKEVHWSLKNRGGPVGHAQGGFMQSGQHFRAWHLSIRGLRRRHGLTGTIRRRSLWRGQK